MRRSRRKMVGEDAFYHATSRLAGPKKEFPLTPVRTWGRGFNIIIPHQNRYNNTTSGDHFIQNMGLPDPPVIIPLRTTVKQARTFKWTEPEGLTAKAKCTLYILEGCPATPILNAEVEVDIND